MYCYWCAIKKENQRVYLNTGIKWSNEKTSFLASKLVEKNGDFYIADNQNIALTVRRSKSFRSLGSLSNSYHLIEVSYYKEHIYVSFHHALCDGGGIKPFVETLIYYYFVKLNNRDYDALHVRKSTDSMFFMKQQNCFIKNMKFSLLKNLLLIKIVLNFPNMIIK